jgi:hypothetical protein
MSKIVEHPKRNLMLEAMIERNVSNMPEAELLQEAIFNTVQAYADFLESHGLIWEDRPEPEPVRMKAAALVVTLDFSDPGTIDISLKDGALDRVYGGGSDPDPYADTP